MAFRVCSRVLGRSAARCAEVSLSARHQPASRVITEGNAACRGSRNGFIRTPACFISSYKLLNRLTKGKAAEGDESFYRIPASVPPDNTDQVSLLLKQPDQPDQSKVLKVAIIGAPNAGKSTISNQLLGRKVFAVSKKVHTTRRRSLGVLTEDETQIILLDTPGLTTPSKVKRHQLDKSMLVDPWNTVKEADLIVVMVDVADKWTCSTLDPGVLKCLAQNQNIPTVLVLNKVDMLRNKDKLLGVTAELTCGMVNGQQIQIGRAIKPQRGRKREPEKRELEKSEPEKSELEKREPEKSEPETDPGLQEFPLDGDGVAELTTPLSKEQLKVLMERRGWPYFKDVFMLSSVDSEDVETLKRYLIVSARPGDWQYHSEVLTDQNPQDICTGIIREKLLDYLPQEVPYVVTQTVELWQESESGELNISVKLCAKKQSHVSMVIGTAGQVVARIAQEASEDLSRIFLREVKLSLGVKLKK